MDVQNISVTILTKNSQKYLKEVLQALSSFGEVLVYDTGSLDDTVSIAKTFPNVNVVEASFVGFGPTHNMASSRAKHTWILSIDSDEIISKELLNELKEIEQDDMAVYSFPRRNYYNGKWIKGCGLFPDRQKRLYNKQSTRFTDSVAYESIISDGMRDVACKGMISHYPFTTISDFLAKMQSYSSYFAEQNRGRKKSSPIKACLHGCFAFMKSYFLKAGLFYGYEGFVISLYQGHTAYYKYIKLHEANLKLKKKSNLMLNRDHSSG